MYEKVRVMSKNFVSHYLVIPNDDHELLTQN